MLGLLVSTSFFNGYDLALLSVLLPNIGEQFGVGEAVLGLARIPIDFGLLAAFFVSRIADRLGRRPVLLWATLGFCAATTLTALSPNLATFIVCQFAARVFLGTEVNVAITMIVEEFPAGRRARALGAMFSCEALGLVAVAVLFGSGLAEGPLGWRIFFLAGLPVLVPLLFARRRLRETTRFREGRAPILPFMVAWQPRYRGTLLAVGSVHLLRAVPLFGATTWWTYYAIREQGFSTSLVGLYLLGSAAVGTFGYLACGQLMTRIGYRSTATVYLVGSGLACVVLFQVDDRAVAFVALVAAIGLGLGIRPVISAFASVPFPTEFRSQATSWVRNWFELPGALLGPAVVGVLGDHQTGLIGNVGDAAALLTVLVLPAVYVIWTRLPELRDRELDDLAG